MPSPDLQQQLQQLQQTLDRLDRRVQQLEGRAVTPTATVIPPTPSVAAVRSVAKTKTSTVAYGQLRVLVIIIGVVFLIAANAVPGLGIAGILLIILGIAWPWKTPAGKIVRATKTPATATATTATVRQPSQFERDLAKHWFSWLGIISLVVGITLFLGYALRDHGAAGRIITGYAAAAMLFGISVWFWKPYRAFAMVLESGAWAVVYVSTYALHTSTNQVVTSPVVAGTLLLLVVALIGTASLWQRSRAMTAGAFFLGYIAAVTNSVDLFTLTAMVILAVGVVAVASFKRWPDFILGGAVATYIVQTLWMIQLGGQLNANISLAAGFLIAEVLIFGLSHWLVRPETNEHRAFILGGTVVNLSGFFFLLHYLLTSAQTTNEWLATLFLAVVCGLLAGITKLFPSRRYLKSTYIVFAISFLTLALSEWLKGDQLAIVVLIESLALVAIGSLSNSRTIRYMGYVVSAVALITAANVLSNPAVPFFGSTTVHSRLIIGLLASVVLTLSAAITQAGRLHWPKEEHFVPVLLMNVGIVVAMATLGAELRASWVPVVWSLGALLALGIGIARPSFNGRIVGYVLHLMSVLLWLATVAPLAAMAGSLPLHSRLVVGLWVTIAMWLSGWMITRQRSALRPMESVAGTGLAWMAVATIVLVLGSEVARGYLSIAWGLVGIVYFAYGFARQSALARRQGLVVMALTIAKVYIYDVQTLPVPSRILSFIILGVLLLLIGYFYNRWRQRNKNGT